MIKRTALLGPEGTFSDIATQEYGKRYGDELEHLCCATIDEALGAVRKRCPTPLLPSKTALTAMCSGRWT